MNDNETRDFRYDVYFQTKTKNLFVSLSPILRLFQKIIFVLNQEVLSFL